MLLPVLPFDFPLIVRSFGLFFWEPIVLDLKRADHLIGKEVVISHRVFDDEQIFKETSFDVAVYRPGRDVEPLSGLRYGIVFFWHTHGSPVGTITISAPRR